MNNKEIFELIDRFESSALGSMKLSCEEFSLELARPVAPVAAAVPAAPVAVPAAVASTPAAEPAADAPMITAPLVGTYYAAPSPDQKPFVQVGDTVKKGQTVCLIEAMKMMSEIPAPCDCVVEAVLKKDGELAAFGDPLIRYRPC
jgi:acetyl-CoA carboxylase biotin carboxyl carrier protein